MISILKLSEPCDNKCKELFLFFNKHLKHNLRVVGDEYNYDGEIIKQDFDKGWSSDYEVFESYSQESSKCSSSDEVVNPELIVRNDAGSNPASCKEKEVEE